MDTKILFREKQQFNQWYIILLFVLLDGFVINRILESDLKSAYENGDIFGFIVMALVTILFILLKMETTIKEDGIYLRFFPIIRSRFYSWESIQNAETVKYNPILYGGWGIRYGVYSVSGNRAIQLQFKNGNKLLIGTQQSEAIQNILNSISNENHTI